MMRHDRKAGFSAVVLALLLAGTACTVVESRRPCPCWATINLDRFSELKNYEDVLTDILINSSLIRSETVALADYVTQPYVQKLKDRIPTTVSCANGFDGMTVRSDSLVCDRGSEVSRVWTASLTQECDGDCAYFDLQPHKDYTTVTFVVLGIVSADDFEYDMRVRANYNGMRLRDRKPIEGAYLAYLRPLEAGVTFELRVPRQLDDEMVLDILSPRSDRSYTTDDRIDVIPLGQRLKAQGFSWDKENLDDVVVTIDIARLDVGVIISEWKEEAFDENI